MRWIAAIVLALVGAGCCHRNKCTAPPTVLTVHDEDGRRLLDATLTGLTGQIVEACGSSQTCSYQIQGTGELTVGAPGRKSIGVSINARVDDCGNAIGQVIEVTLVPESAPSAASVRITAGGGCGG
jgi:hypothetical protein